MNKLLSNLRFVLQSGRPIEVRMLKTRNGTISGYYDDIDKLANDVQFYNGANNIFFTLNSIDPSLLDRSRNHLTMYASSTTKDSEIVKINYILVDLDPERPSGISSNDDEHNYALDQALKVRDDLESEGFRSIIRADSGNGAHLLIPVSLENNKENVDLIKSFLGTLNTKYSDDKVKVDITTHNPARITKLYGSIAVKGDNSIARPHRESCILEDIDTFKIESNERSIIENYVSKYTTQKKMISLDSIIDEAQQKAQALEKVLNIPDWIESHGFQVTKTKPIPNGTLYEISPCPFGNNHDEDGGAFIIQYDNGHLYARCHHSKCSQENWDTLWKKLEGRKRNPNRLFKNAKGKEVKKSTADIIIEHVRDKEHIFFKNQFGELYADIPELSHKVMKVESEDYHNYLINLYYSNEGIAVKKDSIKTAIGVLKATEMYVDNYKPTFMRIGCLDSDKYYYYLNDEKQRVVTIKKVNGVYDYDVVEQNDECMFITNNEMKKQFAPNKHSKPKHSLKVYMEKYFGLLEPKELIVHNVLLCYRFLYGLTQPIAVYIGDKGSGKSSLSSFDVSIINPSSNQMTSKPKTIKDWYVLLNNTDAIVIDNISTLNVAESDLLCQSVQNQSVSSQRKLYSDNSLMIYQLYASLYITSIKLVSYQTDLLDRAIFFHTKRISNSERKEESSFKRQFEQDLPDIMTCIFNVLVKALNLMEADQNKDVDNGYVLRIASFQKYGKYIAEAIGYSQDEFVEALKENVQEVQTDIVVDNDFVSLVKEFVEEKHYVRGKASDIVASIKRYCEHHNREFDTYANTPGKFGKMIGEYREALFSVGIAVCKLKSDGTRYIELADRTSEHFDKICKDGYKMDVDTYKNMSGKEKSAFKNEFEKLLEKYNAQKENGKEDLFK